MKYVSGICLVNGELQSLAEAQVSLLDRCFLYGDGIFETLVAFANTVMDIDKHLDRLRESASIAYINIPWSNEELAFDIQNVVDASNYPKSNVRLIISRGIGLGMNPKQFQPQKYIICTPASTDSQVYTNGLRLKSFKTPYTIRGRTPKGTNYAMSIQANSTLASDYDEVMWVNSENEITEASTSNIFFIARDGENIEIATPSEQSGILLGTTRQKLMDLLKEGDILVEEKIIYLDELARFDEAFVTSTVRGLVPIIRIDQHKLHSARETSVFRSIEKAFLKRIETELGGPVSWYSGIKTH